MVPVWQTTEGPYVVPTLTMDYWDSRSLHHRTDELGSIGLDGRDRLDWVKALEYRRDISPDQSFGPGYRFIRLLQWSPASPALTPAGTDPRGPSHLVSQPALEHNKGVGLPVGGPAGPRQVHVDHGRYRPWPRTHHIDTIGEEYCHPPPLRDHPSATSKGPPRPSARAGRL